MEQKAGLLLRVISKCVDFVIIFAVAEALHKSGWLAGVGYLLISDGLFKGQSLGKKLTGIKVITMAGGPCTFKESLIRNCTLALGLLLWKIPFIGWLFLLAALAFELVVLLGSTERLRLGDELAKTLVVETDGDVIEEE